ncbi:MAG: glycosyltransferase [Candidatus Micrarchaeia archaeon]
MLVSIIIPTKNEPAIGEVIEDLKKELKDFKLEIIVVDKSNDSTPKIAEAHGARVIKQEFSGYGNAYLLGFENANGEIVCMIDGDGTYSASDLKKLINLVKTNKCDFAIGDRFSNLKKEAMPFTRRFGNFFLTWLLNKLYKLKIKDSQSGLRAIKKEALDKMFLSSQDMALASEMLIEARKLNLRVKEIPISYRKREKGRSTNGIIYGVKIAATTIKLLRDYNPFLLFGSVGAIFLIFGFYFAFVVAYDFLTTGTLHFIGRALLSFMFFTFGFLCIILGLILDTLNEIDKKFYKLKINGK